MLLVKTYLDKSTIPNAGIGLFAGQDIKKGKLIWRFEEGFDIKIKLKEIPIIKKLYPQISEFLDTYGYSERGYYIIGMDNDRFINHSQDCNISDSRPYLSFANRDIQKGEELLSDYRKIGRSIADF